MYKPLPSLEFVQSQLSYDPETGTLTWISDLGNKARYLGKVAGWLEKKTGYIRIELEGKKYQAHRLIWLLVTGIDPGDLTVDHKDRNRSNNVWTNLRLATPKQQSENKDHTRLLTFNGITQSLKAWAKQIGLNPSSLAGRLKRNWTLDRALTTPSRFATKPAAK